QQIADVRDHPLRAGLDEPVVVQLLDVELDTTERLLHDPEQGPQGLSEIGVAAPIDGWQQRVEAFDQRLRHGSIVPNVGFPSASTNTWARTMTSLAMCAAKTRSEACGGQTGSPCRRRSVSVAARTPATP